VVVSVEQKLKNLQTPDKSETMQKNVRRTRCWLCYCWWMDRRKKRVWRVVFCQSLKWSLKERRRWKNVNTLSCFTQPSRMTQKLWIFKRHLMKENLTSQLGQAGQITGKNVVQWGSSTGTKKNYRQVRNRFWNIDIPLIQSLLRSDILSPE